MKIQKDAYVSLTYELRTEGTANGPLVEKVTAERPFNFVFGSGFMLKMFEQGIKGLQTGDKFEFSLTPEEAYGEYDEDAVVDVPIDVFKVNGELRQDLLQIGRHVPMMGEGGVRLDGVIKAINEDSINMDFNHPLAGESLYFAGEVLEVREATEEELHPVHRCGGCGGGGCSGGCGGNGSEGDCGCGGGCGEGGCCH